MTRHIGGDGLHGRRQFSHAKPRRGGLLRCHGWIDSRFRLRFRQMHAVRPAGSGKSGVVVRGLAIRAQAPVTTASLPILRGRHLICAFGGGAAWQCSGIEQVDQYLTGGRPGRLMADAIRAEGVSRPLVPRWRRGAGGRLGRFSLGKLGRARPGTHRRVQGAEIAGL